MSLFSEYFKEMKTKELIEEEHGFATYYFLNEGVYVEDIFVRKEFRSQGKAKEMLDKIADIAKEQGCTKMFGSCVPSAKNSTKALQAAFAYGFELYNTNVNVIIYVKDI